MNTPLQTILSNHEQLVAAVEDLEKQADKWLAKRKGGSSEEKKEPASTAITPGQCIASSLFMDG